MLFNIILAHKYIICDVSQLIVRNHDLTVENMIKTLVWLVFIFEGNKQQQDNCYSTQHYMIPVWSPGLLLQNSDSFALPINIQISDISLEKPQT